MKLTALTAIKKSSCFCLGYLSVYASEILITVMLLQVCCKSCCYLEHGTSSPSLLGCRWFCGCRLRCQLRLALHVFPSFPVQVCCCSICPRKLLHIYISNISLKQTYCTSLPLLVYLYTNYKILQCHLIEKFPFEHFIFAIYLFSYIKEVYTNFAIKSGL